MKRGNKKAALVVIAFLALFAWIGYNDSKPKGTSINTPVNYPSNQSTLFYQTDPGFDFNAFNSDTTLNDQPARSELCPVCYGSGACQICNGKGWTVGYNGDDTSCSACDDYSGGINDDGTLYGNGRCSTCHGTGFYN